MKTMTGQKSREQREWGPGEPEPPTSSCMPSERSTPSQPSPLHPLHRYIRNECLLMGIGLTVILPVMLVVLWVLYG